MFFKFLYIFIILVFLAGVFAPVVFAATISGQDPPTDAVKLFTGFQDGFLGFLRWLFPVMIASAAVIATLSIIFAGFQWMAGAISPPQVEAAKSRISASVLGLAVALTSWLILNTINPDLVNLRRPKGFELPDCTKEACPSWTDILFGAGETKNDKGTSNDPNSIIKVAGTDLSTKTEEEQRQIFNVLLNQFTDTIKSNEKTDGTYYKSSLVSDLTDSDIKTLLNDSNASMSQLTSHQIRALQKAKESAAFKQFKNSCRGRVDSRTSPGGLTVALCVVPK